MSPAQGRRAGGAFHALLLAVEPLGVVFRKSRSKYESGYFERGNDRLYLRIEEELIEGPAAARRGRSVGRWNVDTRVPAGRLSFSLRSEHYRRGKAEAWSEGAKDPIDRVLAKVLAELRSHFRGRHEHHKKEAIEAEKRKAVWRVEQAERERVEAIRRAEAEKVAHADALVTTKRRREDDFLLAAEWWRLHQNALAFVEACEARFRSEADGELTAETTEWLRWARATAGVLSPLTDGYPDPERDGGFDPEAVAFGGPYPATRGFPRPPTMPVIPEPEVKPQGYGGAAHTPPKPYPFWLKHQR